MERKDYPPMKRNTITTGFLILCALLFSCNPFTYSQTISCPPNMDFEFGDLTSWRCEWGGGPGNSYGVSTGPSAPPPPSVPMSIIITPYIGSLPNLHHITSGTGTDLYGGFPVVCPGGGAHSLRTITDPDPTRISQVSRGQ